jgi:alpha-N-arabinofuranosidase
MGKEIHVSKKGCDESEGTISQPYLTIGRAAVSAEAGDTIIVHEGVYREWVNPSNGGTSDIDRITYQAAPGEKVVIKGSEQIKDWELVEGQVWKTIVPNSMFGDYNPYSEELFGDWFIYPYEWKLHTGDVYLNGKSFYEAKSLEEVIHPQIRTEGYNPPWTKHREPILYPEDTVYQWYAKADKVNTTIYANFQETDPNEEVVEINVRKCCFYPEKTGRNYITVKGFEMSQAASPWTPPTADQPGLLGANWSKGWIIEDNCIHDAKCSGISIGKESSTGHNLCTNTHRKPGYQYQMEAVFRALQIGWSKETIGSHIIRNNEIYDCGQNGIVGHMGCIFSHIYNNHIYNIAVKHEYFGYEIAGIKLHAAIDVQIARNNIHNCSLGIWLDWEAQGTRVSKNLFYRNDRDLMIEVTHGPHLVDHNILASEYNLDNIAQGGAYVHNLFCGTMRREPVLDRGTPYHFPHTTTPAGTTFVYGGDDRWYQNIFVGGTYTYTAQSTSGTADYDGSPSSLEEYKDEVMRLGVGDHETFQVTKDPVYINKNVYYNGALPFEKEQENLVSAKNPEVKICEEQDGTYLEMTIEEEQFTLGNEIIDTLKLGTVRISEGIFDSPNGEAIILDTDYKDIQKESNSPAGPFAELKAGYNKIKIWNK